MTGVLNEAMRKGIPEEWRTSTITPIWGASRKLATSVNQGDKILTIMDVLKCTQII